MSKPIAHYTRLASEVKVGMPVFLCGVYDHHNGQIIGHTVITSPVREKLSDTEFITMNTHYKPKENAP